MENSRFAMIIPHMQCMHMLQEYIVLYHTHKHTEHKSVCTV
jgi:hypothetical protein